MPIVLDPPESPPIIPPAEDASNLWELVYEAMGFHRDEDASTGYQLQQLCEGLTGPVQPLYDLLREREGQKGWTVLFDPDECPVQFLPYLAQYTGVRPVPEMDEAQLRAEIKAPTGWRRGQPETIRVAVPRTLKPVADEELMVIIRPRTLEVGEHFVRTLLSQTPDPERTHAIVREAVPAWEKLNYEAIDGVTFEDIAAGWEDFDALAGAFATFKDLAEILPSELP
jgi:hypothetical protein